MAWVFLAGGSVWFNQFLRPHKGDEAWLTALFGSESDTCPCREIRTAPPPDNADAETGSTWARWHRMAAFAFRIFCFILAQRKAAETASIDCSILQCLFLLQDNLTRAALREYPAHQAHLVLLDVQVCKASIFLTQHGPLDDFVFDIIWERWFLIWSQLYFNRRFETRTSRTTWTSRYVFRLINSSALDMTSEVDGSYRVHVYIDYEAHLVSNQTLVIIVPTL